MSMSFGTRNWDPVRPCRTDGVLVSVVIPVCNGERYIADAIESVLRQSHSPVETIVVDDGSVDGTSRVLETFESDPSVRVARHDGGRNLGVSKSRRLGVALAAGEFVAFLDADDVFAFDKVSKQVSTLMESPGIVLSHGRVKLETTVHASPDIGSAFDLGAHEMRYNLLDQEYAFRHNHICNSSVMVRRECLAGLSFEADQLFQYEDWVLWLLLAERGDFLYSPEPLVNYRYHSDSATAGVIARPLRHYYSMLEKQMTLMTRLNSGSARARLLAELRRNLIDLVVAYSPHEGQPESSPAIAIAAEGLFNVGDEDVAAALALAVNRLEAEKKRLCQRLDVVESSVMWKVVRRIEDLFGRLVKSRRHR